MFLVCHLQEFTIVDAVVAIVVGAAHSTGKTEIHSTGKSSSLCGNGSSQVVLVTSSCHYNFVTEIKILEFMLLLGKASLPHLSLELLKRGTSLLL